MNLSFYGILTAIVVTVVLVATVLICTAGTNSPEDTKGSSVKTETYNDNVAQNTGTGSSVFTHSKAPFTAPRQSDFSAEMGGKVKIQ